VPPRVAAAVLALAVAAAACSGGGDSVRERRASQARDAARDAGLSGDVQDFLALASRASTATFQVTYPAADESGAEIVVSQDPPDRRIDTVKGTKILESRIRHRSTSYLCRNQDSGWTCARTATGAAPLAGLFDEDAVRQTTLALKSAKVDYTFAVAGRRLAGVEATCLTTTRRRDRPGAARSPAAGTLCLSPDGVVLLIERPGQRLQASGYTTRPPKGTFTLPARPT
jgi:hypothetical protein